MAAANSFEDTAPVDARADDDEPSRTIGPGSPESELTDLTEGSEGRNLPAMPTIISAEATLGG